MKKIYFLFCFLFATQFIANSQVVINEYSASNSNLVADYAGNFSDFVELFNTSGTAVNLGGYHLSDDITNIPRWTFPTTVSIPANGRIIVYCSGDDTITPGGQIHTNFHLTQCKNNKIIFSTSASAVVDSLTLIRTQNNHSRGRTTDGAASWSLFINPTPNATNNNAFAGYADRPTMSVAPGFYTASQNVVLSTTQPNITIRYTVNGLAPTATSTVYTAPIVVPNTMVIRAACFSSNAAIMPSFTETNTYFINVTHSSPFNVISLCGNYNTLFGTGNEVRTSMEFFDTTKTFKWEFEGGSRRHGNDSWAYPQKGFRVYPYDEYGYLDKINEKFFKTTPRQEFKTIILKAAASDNYNGNTGQLTAHMRDAYCHTFSIKHGWEFDERSYAPTIIYINGQYWGVYEIRDRVDEDYVDYYYNQSKKKIDMVRHWGGATNIIDAGSDTGWTNLKNFIVTNNMTIPANYAYVESVLNINSFIDFFVLNNYIANSDHLNYNTMWWRGRKGAGVKWKYALWDQDNIFNLGENFANLPTTGPELDPCAPFSLFTGSNIIFHTQMVNGLLTSPKFKKQYQDRYANWLSTSLTCDSLLAHLKYFEDLLAPEMPAQIARWPAGGNSLAKWHNNVDSIRDFILKRCSLIGSANDSSCIAVKKIILNVDAIGMGKIKFNTTLLNTYPHKQVTGGDSVYNIEAIANPGFRFVKWLFFNTKNTISPTINSPIAFLDYRDADSIVALFEIKPLDTFNIIITASPTWAGSVLIDGVTLINSANFPYTFKAVEKTSHTLLASPDADHVFNKWTQINAAQNPVVGAFTEKQIGFTANANDVFTALFDTLVNVNTKVFVPNGFTPNGDDVNDYFGISSKQHPFVTDVFLNIYDRFGENIYRGNGLNNGWDGKQNGAFVSVGTYMYLLEVTYTDGKKKKFKGDVMMIR
jgi:gliding motility-associated-like protein